MLRELVAVYDKFRVSASAKFVEIHSLPLSVSVHAMGVHAINQPVQTIGHREDETEQSRETDHLRQPLPIGSGTIG